MSTGYGEMTGKGSTEFRRQKRSNRKQFDRVNTRRPRRTLTHHFSVNTISRRFYSEGETSRRRGSDLNEGTTAAPSLSVGILAKERGRGGRQDSSGDKHTELPARVETGRWRVKRRRYRREEKRDERWKREVTGRLFSPLSLPHKSLWFPAEILLCSGNVSSQQVSLINISLWWEGKKRKKFKFHSCTFFLLN